MVGDILLSSSFLKLTETQLTCFSYKVQRKRNVSALFFDIFVNRNLMYERFTGVKSFNPVFNKFSQIVKKCIFKAELVKPQKIF